MRDSLFEGFRIQTLDEKVWAWAVLIGGQRMRSHDKIRSVKHNRGRENFRVDLMGAFGELCLWKAALLAERSAAADKMAQEMWLPTEELHRVGEWVDLEDEDLQLDAKTFDCSPHKAWIALNARKHRGLEGRCDGYYLALAPLWGTQVLEVLVPYDDVSSWQKSTLGKYGDPSFNEPVGRFLRRYANGAALPTHQYPKAAVTKLVHSQECRRELASHFPTLSVLVDD